MSIGRAVNKSRRLPENLIEGVGISKHKDLEAEGILRTAETTLLWGIVFGTSAEIGGALHQEESHIVDRRVVSIFRTSRVITRPF
jgi:hypothetical protein